MSSITLLTLIQYCGTDEHNTVQLEIHIRFLRGHAQWGKLILIRKTFLQKVWGSLILDLRQIKPFDSWVYLCITDMPAQNRWAMGTLWASTKEEMTQNRKTWLILCNLSYWSMGRSRHSSMVYSSDCNDRSLRRIFNWGKPTQHSNLYFPRLFWLRKSSSWKSPRKHNAIHPHVWSKTLLTHTNAGKKIQTSSKQS